MNLPPELLTLLKQRSACYIATTMPDGSEDWIDDLQTKLNKVP